MNSGCTVFSAEVRDAKVLYKFNTSQEHSAIFFLLLVECKKPTANNRE
jgi:hypothetical protein